MTPPKPPPPLPVSAALFLDFDGTLVPIAPRPQDVRVPAGLVGVLDALREGLDGALAIVSGRPIAQIDEFLHPLRLTAVGAHGAERRLAGGALERRHAEPPPGIVACAGTLVAEHDGLILETKPSGLALHYRARPELEARVQATLTAALAAAPGAGATWEWLNGHLVFELKQRGVSKGLAVRALLATPPFAGREPVFIGDDVTDEDGIVAVQDAGGFGIAVGVRASAARYRMAGPVQVAEWLRARAERGASAEPRS